MAGVIMDPASTGTSLDYAGNSHMYGKSHEYVGDSQMYGSPSVFPQSDTYEETPEGYNQRLNASNEASSFEDFFASEVNYEGRNPATSASLWDKQEVETSPDSGWNKFRPSEDLEDSDSSSVDMDLMDKYSTGNSQAIKTYDARGSTEQFNQQDLFSAPLRKSEKNYENHASMDKYSHAQNVSSSVIKPGQSYETKAASFQQEMDDSGSDLLLSPTEIDDESDSQEEINIKNSQVFKSYGNVDQSSDSALMKSSTRSFEAWREFKNETEKQTEIIPESRRSESPASLDDFMPGQNEEIEIAGLKSSMNNNSVGQKSSDLLHSTKYSVDEKFGDPLDTERSEDLLEFTGRQKDVLETDRTTGSLDTQVLLKDFEEKVLVNSKRPTTIKALRSSSKPKTTTSHKPAPHDTDIRRKYQSYINSKAPSKSHNALKKDFVNEMLSRAQEKHGEDNYYKSYDGDQTEAKSGEYSKKYPRGVTLSKTFTKASSYKSGSLKWNSGKYEELAYGPRNIFNSKKYNSSKSANLTKYSHPDVNSKGWTAHEQPNGDHANDQDAFKSQDDINGDIINASIIDESYYKDILKSSKVVKPLESSGEIDIELSENAQNTTYTKPIVQRPNSAAKVKSRPGSASGYLRKTQPKTATRSQSAMSVYRPESALSTIRPESALSGLSLEGIKQDTGPKKNKPKSSVGRYRTNHCASYVDETLFGKGQAEPSFEAPWGERDQVGKKPLPYVAITSMEPHLDRKTEPPKQNSNATRQTAVRNRPVSATTKKKQNKELSNFHNTYVDEMLFGKKADEPSFRAPWDNGNQPKPHAFDGTNYRSTEVNTVSQKKPQTSNDARKPVWK